MDGNYLGMIPTSVPGNARLEDTPEHEIDRLMEIFQGGGEDFDVLTPAEEHLLRQHLNQIAGEKAGSMADFGANLAEFLDEQTLTQLATQVIDWVDTDDRSRGDWKNREAVAIRMLGFSDKTEGGADFEGASRVVYPLLGEAIIQFQARAIAELWPAQGPVDTHIVGKKDPERNAQADRVRTYMNYQYTHDMPGAFDEEDKLLFRLPLSGSCFIKPYFDPMFGKIVRRFVDANEFVVPYRATDLHSAPRYTHVMLESVNEVRRKMVMGLYRDIPLGEGSEIKLEAGQEVKDEIDHVEGREDPGNQYDERYTDYEMHVYLILPGDEHRDRWGLKTGLARPYIVTVNKDHHEVLSIYRNWKAEDPTEKKLMHFVHRKFFPGLGFYGFGYLHILGGLQRAATGASRALLDAAQFANMPSGLRAKTGAKIPDGTFPIAPGEWPEVEATYDDLKKAFFNIPHKDISEGLVKMLQILVEAGQRFASISDAVVGDTPTNAPVGTTLAVIEQAVKLFSGIHKRQHEGLKEEFQIVARLNADHLGDEYAYEVEDQEHFIAREDFDERIDILPVSDPNIVTSTQRIATAQVEMDLSERAPDLYDRREVHRRFLEAIRVQNIDAILLDPDKIPRKGVVEENMAMSQNQPVRAFIEQDHAAHVMGHQLWFQTIPPGMQAQYEPAYMAHLAEHVALAYQVQVLAALGGQYPEIEEGEELPIEVENMIAQQVAQITQLTALPLEQPDPTAAEQARKDAIAAADVARKDALAKADIDRKNALAKSTIDRQSVETAAGLAREHIAAMQRENRLNAEAQANMKLNQTRRENA